MSTLIRKPAPPHSAGVLRGESPLLGEVIKQGESPQPGTTGSATPPDPCPIPECDLFGPHELHRDSEGFEWRQRNPLPLDDEAWQRDEAQERAWKHG